MQRKPSRRKMVKTSFTRSQMEQSNRLEDIRFSENPPSHGIDPREAWSAKMIFEENRTGFNHYT